ncbi:hypothetical protein JMA_40460 (plasmid) [Jeotgalibacillus malaysiensis]|uniref:Uncharacterized protein n=1 Tax=Jeotgalibacillus malaysiensis TaxID=1508404 RepID=A0A0B5AZM0_9BACL|nr:hypothetical protein [Jeotgalibacillus malaysiensis]AJD93364.1 hypothetical protein JMA_40460 [Jeotgalibacillus malaysiensis]
MKSVALEQTGIKFFDWIDSVIESFRTSITLEVTVPSAVYARTRLLCEYISEKVGVRYTVSEFIMTIYEDFLQECISKYQPKRIYEQITREYGYGQTLTIHMNEEIATVQKRPGTRTILTIEIGKRDAEKGELILEEMDEMFGQVPTLEGLLGKLWTNFIEEYKQGNNQKALNAIIRMLKKEAKEMEE